MGNDLKKIYKELTATRRIDSQSQYEKERELIMFVNQIKNSFLRLALNVCLLNIISYKRYNNRLPSMLIISHDSHDSYASF